MNRGNLVASNEADLCNLDIKSVLMTQSSVSPFQPSKIKPSNELSDFPHGVLGFWGFGVLGFCDISV